MGSKRMSVLQAEAHLSPEQRQVAEWYAMPKAERPSKEEMEKQVSVSFVTIRDWLKKPEVETLRRSLVRNFFISRVPEVVNAVYEKSLKGDMMAARLFLEYVRELEKTMPANNTFNMIVMDPADLSARIAELRRKTAHPEIIRLNAAVEPKS